ncbi:DOPA 4,5-dioxygenase family protein [Burkholderia sp. AU39826]|uniref:DOPA 4,5-dioxygenase family protein n=1 Tax=Burkholderia sp. AU39826 TaxID=2879634 RepID=UPI001CF4AAA6|nr:DOPA 4,5-dioxygenase family protein [Burkholderia sp. AU39826]MCA7968271.1 DOPA 4,5-dioxygenase family protein [Burkholderia sp. AU39826]
MLEADVVTPEDSQEHLKVQPLETIRSYHAHIYFDGPEQRRVAEVLREQIAQRFAVVLGPWHDRPIGPHAKPMYQVAFSRHEFGSFLPWLMVNRRGLTVLVHPNTGHPLADHLDHPVWMGEVLDILNRQLLPLDEGPETDLVTNTRPTVNP